MPWWHELTAFVDGSVNASEVADATDEVKSSEDLCDADFIAVQIFDAEVTGRERSFDAGFDGDGFNDFVYVGEVDDVFVVEGGAPGPRVDFADDGFLHIFDDFVEVVTKEIIEECAGGIDAFVVVGVTVMWRYFFDVSEYELVGHMTEEVEFTFGGVAVWEQVGAEDIMRIFLFTFDAGFFVYAHRDV